jgi:MFS family permease
VAVSDSLNTGDAVSSGGQGSAPSEPSRRWLPLLLAMAMFVLVVDTTIMNVSISAVAESLGTTVSSVQSAIALEALVSAAFILINSKIGDLIGRKRAYLIGLAAYAIGAVAMTLAQSVAAIIVFWAIIGGLGASLLLPAMQSLIHGNFEGAARAKVYAVVGASAAIAAAIGPLIGGVITTFCPGGSTSYWSFSSSRSSCQGRDWLRTSASSAIAVWTSSEQRSRSWAWAGSCLASSFGKRAAKRLRL